MSHAYVAELLRLTLLAPEIVEAVLDRRAKGLMLEEVVRAPAAGWGAELLLPAVAQSASQLRLLA